MEKARNELTNPLLPLEYRYSSHIQTDIFHLAQRYFPSGELSRLYLDPLRSHKEPIGGRGWHTLNKKTIKIEINLIN